MSYLVHAEVKEEKVLSVYLEVDASCRVSKLVISGDFFAFPPELLDEAESKASGADLEGVVRVVGEYLDRVVLVGVSRAKALEVLRRAVEEGLRRCRGG
jgi:dihydroorotase-like cyclic amidohydrolase